MLDDPTLLLYHLVMPALMMLITRPLFRLALVEEGYELASGAEQAVPGIAIMFSAFAAGLAGFAFFRDHGWRIWDRFRVGARSGEIVAGKLAPPLAVSVLQLFLLFAFGILLVDLRVEGSLLALGLVAVSLSVCLQAFGAAAAAITRTAQQLNVLANVGGLAFVVVGGAFIPLSLLPAWVTAIAPGVPTFWAMRAFRAVILDGAGLAEVLLPTAVMLGFAGGFALIAALSFRAEQSKVFWG